MNYNVFFADKKAHKQFDALSPLVKPRITDAIKNLAAEPRPHGVKKLKGKLGGVWRLRIGDFRLLYDIDEKKKEVVLLNLDHRRQIYR